MFYNRNQKIKVFSSNNKNKLFTYKKEVCAVFIFSIFALLAISFLSFNPNDSSWFHFSSDSSTISNWAGTIGANISSFFFYYLGSASYVLLFTLLFLAYLLFFKKSLKEHLDRFFALIILLLCSSTLLKAFNIDISKTYPGGWVGNFIYGLLQPYLGFAGTLVLVFMLLWISFSILFRFSFLNSLFFLLGIARDVIYFIVKKTTKYLFVISKYIFFKFIALIKAIFRKIKSMFSKKDGGSEGTGEWEEYKSSLEGKRKDIKTEERTDEDKSDDFLNRLDSMAKNLNSGFFASPAEDQNGSKTISDDPQDILEDLILGDNRIEKIVQKFKNKEIFRNVHFSETLSVLTRSEYRFSSELADLIMLPNTVLYKNIFAQLQILGGLSVFQFITQQIKKIIIQPLDKLGAKGGRSTKEAKKDKIEFKYNLPDLSIFKDENGNSWESQNLEKECEERGKKLEEKLHRFGIRGNVVAIKPGPVVTLFEFKPEIDSKISRIIALEDDLAMALTAMSIRIIAPIPGRNVVGFEIANQTRSSVFLSDLMLTNEFEKFEGKIPLTLGVDIVGRPIIEDLVYMPHLLVAGSTGSGKSVGLNAMLIGLLCKFRPDELKLILIDPKRLEFAPYAGVPHLLFPIITNPRQAAPVLKWVVQEMENRYETMAAAGVRNILEYKKLYESASSSKIEELKLSEMPFIVIMIDELADLMMVAGKDVETQIARIAQMARAAGIHMIVATQRPSVDVVTGLIKVNFPSRLAFRVSSKIDSRTIVDSQGAEKLLGRGDMLYLNSSSSDLVRLHGAYVSDSQVEELTTYLRSQQKPEYLDLNEELKRIEVLDDMDFEDDLYDEIIEFVKQREEISISMIQRQYRIGFNRSARIIERLELDGLLAPAQGSKPRKVLG